MPADSVPQVVRGWSHPDDWQRGRNVRVWSKQFEKEFTPVLVIPLTPEGEIPEELVQRVAEVERVRIAELALWSDPNELRNACISEARAVLSALLSPSSTETPEHG